MYIAPGLLDQRLRLYRREDAGADGFQRPVYVYTATRWGRLDVTADTSTVPMAPQAHVEERAAATAFLATDSPVSAFGVIRVGYGPALYYVRGIVQTRALQLQRVELEAIDPTRFAEFTLYEGESVLDGTHLVAVSGFSSGFNEGFA